MRRRVVVPLANGFEEIEAVTIIDVLRRADIEVRVLGTEGRQVTGAHGIHLTADGLLEEEGDGTFDAVILPGGMPGAATLRDDPAVQDLIRRQHGSGRLVAAICAAPMALSSAGVLQSREATGYPGFDLDCGRYLEEEAVVVDGHVITSRGPGTAIPFALTVVQALLGEQEVAKLRKALLVDLGARALQTRRPAPTA